MRAEAKEHAEHFFAPLTRAERRALHELLTKLASEIE